MMDELMTLCFPLKSEMMTTVRLVTGGLCSLAGLDLDDSEDCKVCVTESLLLLSRRGYSEAKVTFRGTGRLDIRLEGVGERAASEERPAEDEISAALLSALVEDLDMAREDGEINSISFGFGAK